jgi:hypothetical protein
MFNIILVAKAAVPSKNGGVMACSLRIDVPDGWYHVLNRGVERQIFP